MNWEHRRREILARDGPQCAYCGVVSPSPHIDHIRPVASGRDDDPANLQVLCPFCNWEKGSDLRPWLEVRAFEIEEERAMEQLEREALGLSL